MTCDSCAETIQAAGGKTRQVIDVGKEEVLVEASLTSNEVQGLIESTGRRAVLKGIGGTEEDLGAAVAMIVGSGPVQGVVRFLQLSEERCLIDGTWCPRPPRPRARRSHTGLPEVRIMGPDNSCFSLCVCLYSCGEHYNPYGRQHGASQDPDRHVGDLGNIVAGPDGRASFRQKDPQLKVWDVIGRSLVVDAGEDDLGRSGHPPSKLTGNSRQRLACGIIARSAVLFQNAKQICACDVVTLWEERDRPLAGNGAAARPPQRHLPLTCDARCLGHIH
uniref:Superoxide dismutase [Cu-Zn] n=1 Tax=Oncorhynchus tshawytscha TaxID=74940 RepID=A0A8C8K316_ONCTS